MPAARTPTLGVLRLLLVMALCLSCGAPAGSGSSTRSGDTAGPEPVASRSGPAPSSRYPIGSTIYPAGSRTALPAVQGTTLDGASLAVSTFRGHVVVLNVWASWCVPCRSETPALAASAASLAPTGVRVVGMDENDTPADAQAFARSAGSDYPSLRDDGMLLAELAEWLPAALPGTLIVDPDGRVAARVVGAVTQTELLRIVSGVQGSSTTAGS